MPRHTFRIPEAMRDAVQRYVERAISGVAPTRYRQEPQYLTAVAHALDGIAYEGEHGKVVFTSTIFDDRGANSAEKRLGADLAITAVIDSQGDRVRKAIIFQAKLGDLHDISPSKAKELRSQVKKMIDHTRSPKIIEIPSLNGERSLRVHSGRRYHSGATTRAVPFPEYVTSRVLTTLDGDTREAFIDAVQNSEFPGFHIDAFLARTTA
jgi:hypothetical protein